MACVAVHRRVHDVDHPRGSQAALKRRGQSDRADREEFVELPPQAPRDIRILRLNPIGEPLHPRLARLGIQLPGGSQHRSGLVVELPEQMADHIEHLLVSVAPHQADAPDMLVLDEALERPQRDDGVLASIVPGP